MRPFPSPRSRSAHAASAAMVLSWALPRGPFSESDLPFPVARGSLRAMASGGLLEEGAEAPSGSGRTEMVYQPTPLGAEWLRDRDAPTPSVPPCRPHARRRGRRPGDGPPPSLDERRAEESAGDVGRRASLRPPSAGGFRKRISAMLSSRPPGERSGCGRGRPIGSSHAGEDFSEFMRVRVDPDAPSGVPFAKGVPVGH